MTAAEPSAESGSASERAAIVGLVFGARRRDPVESSLDELTRLVVTAGATVVYRTIQERPKPDPALFIGRGKAETLARAAEEAKTDLVVFDDELTPGQLRNLERVLARRVVDRTQLILDIFASRARTREGKLQVELAQLKYLLPRLAGVGTALSRLGAGIGTRGPGETKLETDRRRIRLRIGRLTRELETVRRRRSQLRARRHKRSVPTVALVGYTNAGKTSLFGRLTGSEVTASSALFATLDPLVRPLSLADQRAVLVSDTVGFIDRLPHTLVAAFRATLEEVGDADLLLHVVDASHTERERRMGAVNRVLEEVGAGEVPRLLVFNKGDRITARDRARLRAAYPGAYVVSALTGTGHQDLVDGVTRALAMETRRVTLELDDTVARDRRRLVQVYQQGRVLRHVTRDGHVSIEAEVPIRLATRWRSRTVGEQRSDREPATEPARSTRVAGR